MDFITVGMVEEFIAMESWCVCFVLMDLFDGVFDGFLRQPLILSWTGCRKISLEEPREIAAKITLPDSLRPSAVSFP